MNYVRIYEAFIQGRRKKESEIVGYSERHHIVPRCMGGDDSGCNLIQLTPEDHFFAHLVLAKAHGGRDLWAACLLMANIDGRANAIKFRRMYGVVRRRWGEAAVGENAANADLTKYRFYHVDGATFEGTRIAFGAFANVPPASVNLLVRGVQRIVYEWSMQPTTRKEERRKAGEIARRNGLALKGFVRDAKLYHFYHKDTERSIIATQIGMIGLGLLSRSNVSGLICGTRLLSKGWCLAENVGLTQDRFSNRRRKEVYTFVNSMSGQRRTGTLFELGKCLNHGDSRPIGEVVNGRKRGWMGWHLEGCPPPRVLNRSYVLVHRKTGSRISGSQAELCSKIGVSKMAVNRVLTGRASHVRDWACVA